MPQRSCGALCVDGVLDRSKSLEPMRQLVRVAWARLGSNTAILQALRLGAANSLNQAGQQVVSRNLNIQPTLTVRPGFPIRVIVNRDLVLEAYRG